MSELKILSMNCRGLGEQSKRRDVLNYLKSKNYSIYCVQDTHFTKEEENYIRACWGYDIYMSPGRSNARGVAVLLNNNFDCRVTKQKSDNEGNLIILEIIIEEKHKILLLKHVNCYFYPNPFI